MSDRLREAVELLEAHGTVAEASRVSGIPRTTIRDRLEKAARGGVVPKKSVAPSKVVESELKAEIELLKAEQKRDKSTIEKLEQSIDRLRKVDKKGLFKPLKEKGSKGDYIRVVIPDTHGMFVDQDAVNAMLGDIESLTAKEVVLLGDHLDCGGFLAQHHVLNYQAELQYSYEQDCEAANQFLDQVQKSANGSTIHYLDGNHERRVSKWIVSATLRNPSDASMLSKLLEPRSVLHMEQRGLKFYPQEEFHMGLRVRGAIKLGKCYFTHGTNHSRHSSAKHAQQFSGCVVHGHIHREQSDMIAPVAVGAIGAWCPGCLCKLQPMYRHTCPSNWTHGYAIQFVRADGEFLHLNIPIVDGRSFLGPLLDIVS
jgi:UDP-2,3-diacylglucosamine pyrophosphatase LpxH